MPDAALEDAKAGLRTMALQRRAAIDHSERAEAARRASAHFVQHVGVGPGETVALYWPIRDELDSKVLLGQLMDAGHRVCLPVVLGEALPLELRLWEQGAPLYPSGFGTLAPDGAAPIIEPDIIVMPLLGYDREGTRLGYGGGYYDRTLAKLATRPRLVGYAFACQELDGIPREAHDIPLTAIVTETGYRQFGGPV